MSDISDVDLFSPERFPVLSGAGRAMLRRLVEHPAAPVFRNRSGHRLDRRALWEARWRHWRLRRAAMPERSSPMAPPSWADEFLARGAATVPAFHGLQGRPWHKLPTCSRSDLSSTLNRYMPNTVDIGRLIGFSTSGTTGHPMNVPSLPRVAADYLAFHDRALALFGLRRRAGRGDVGIVLAGHQQRCFTYVSVNPLSGECGLVKLNLNPSEWKQAEDRARYLDALAPELISGDPISLAELASLEVQHRPLALLSTSMALSAGLRHELEARFGCPVLDLYSMNEVGPIGVYEPSVDAFVLLQPGLHVEVVDPKGHPVPFGVSGEVVVSGGFNPCLPLLRYRTGDFAKLEASPLGWVLRDLVGRAPVRYQAPSGRWFNNVDVTQTLSPFPLVQYGLHQEADGRLRLKVNSREPLEGLRSDLHDSLCARFGEALPLQIEALASDELLRQYTSDLPGAHVRTGTANSLAERFAARADTQEAIP